MSRYETLTEALAAHAEKQRRSVPDWPAPDYPVNPQGQYCAEGSFSNRTKCNYLDDVGRE